MLDRFERFSFLVFEVSRCWHKLAVEEMEKHGLGSAHAVYLTILYQHPDGVTAAKLADLCARDKSDVSRMISIMEKKGLVVREAVGANRYRALLKLTAAGSSAAEHVRQRARIAVEHAGTGVTDEDRTIFYQVFEMITSNLQQLCKEGLPQN